MERNYAVNLAKLRRERDISQRAAAEELGVSQALLSHYENGVREPRFEFVERVCRYYGVSADYLLGMSDKKTSMEDVVEELGGSDAVRDLLLAFERVFGMLAGADERLPEMAAQYVSMALAAVIRMMDPAQNASDPACDAAVKLAESELSKSVCLSGVTLEGSDELLKKVSEIPYRVLAQYRGTVGVVEE